MPSFRLELDEPDNFVLVLVTEDDGSEHDYRFDFDPSSGRWDFSQRETLERDFGADWVEELESAVRTRIGQAVGRTHQRE